ADVEIFQLLGPVDIVRFDDAPLLQRRRQIVKVFVRHATTSTHDRLAHGAVTVVRRNGAGGNMICERSVAMRNADPADARAATAADADPVAPSVAFDHVSFAFDDSVVLRDVSFDVPKGSMRLLLGPSGAGKSIILKLILGLLKPDSGKILVNGQRIDEMPESSLLLARADMAMSFQESALFDSLTVEENVGYRLYEESDMPGDQARERVEDVLALVGLTEYIDR